MEEEAGGEYTVQAGHQGLHRAALLPHTQHKVFPDKNYFHSISIVHIVIAISLSYVFSQETSTGCVHYLLSHFYTEHNMKTFKFIVYY